MTTDRIVEYLRQYGRMSGQDIVDDLGATEADVCLAEQDGYIRRVAPEPCGRPGSWYDVR